MELDDHFEDFTTASEWEQFIARLEQLLTECNACPLDPSNVTNNWVAVHHKISFSDFPFKFSYFKHLDEETTNKKSKSADASETVVTGKSLEGETPLPDFLSSITKTDPEFPPKYVPHVVGEYFNLNEFAVISSASSEPVHKESRLKILLSSACISINNTSCNFPIFVQFHHWSQQYFSGIGESSGIRTSFQMVMLQPSPAIPTHLSGLLDVFKSKIGPNLPNPVGISTHFFYKIKSWPPEINCESYPPELFELLQPKEGLNEDKNVQFCALLPFGSLDDPFVSLDLVAGWPQLTEDVVVDSPTYSDLEPENSQELYFSLKADPNAEFRLNELVDGIWKLKTDCRTTEQVLGKPIETNNDGQNFSSALEKLTRSQVVPLPLPVVGINVLGSTARRKAYFSTDPNAYEDLAPLTREQMDLIIDFLFPDAKKDSVYCYPAEFQDNHKFRKDYINNLMENLSCIKSAPVGSLVWRLSIILSHLLSFGSHQGSTSVVAHVWAELILELRFRMENSKIICGLESGSPNIGSCLLNQKLQMLNCCIQKKIGRETKQNEGEKSSQNALDSDIEGSDDEFFDCEEDNMDDDSKEIPKFSKPAGRLRKNDNLRLLNTGEPMYIPETQDPAPLTEDVIEEQSKIMIELGNNAQGSELRAKMMSISLLSDMESFKAANPGAVLEDFVRWYSPRDWIEKDETDKFGELTGELSPRMKLPGNLWLEMWSTANPIPARRQRRLFDDTKEAEKVLHWLSTRTLADLSQLLFPCAIHAAVIKVLDEADTLSLDYELPSSFLQNVTHLTRCFRCVAMIEDNSDSDISSYKNLVMKGLLQCEREITQIRSFQLKFPNENISEILNLNKASQENGNSSELFPTFIKVANGKRSDLGSKIFELFKRDVQQENYTQLNESEQQQKMRNFGQPFKRVFVLKYNPPVKVNHSNRPVGLPHRMSCLLKNDMIVMAGTFSTKTHFI